MTDDQGGFNLAFPYEIAFADIGTATTYAMVIVIGDRGLQMIDLSDPANPAAAGFTGRRHVDGFPAS